VYMRDEIAKGLSEVATPGWYYLDKWNDREGARAELDETEFWFDDKGISVTGETLFFPVEDNADIIEPVHDEPDETQSYQAAFDAGYYKGYDKGWYDAAEIDF